MTKKIVISDPPRNPNADITSAKPARKCNYSNKQCKLKFEPKTFVVKTTDTGSVLVAVKIPGKRLDPKDFCSVECRRVKLLNKIRAVDYLTSLRMILTESGERCKSCPFWRDCPIAFKKPCRRHV